MSYTIIYIVALVEKFLNMCKISDCLLWSRKASEWLNTYLHNNNYKTKKNKQTNKQKSKQKQKQKQNKNKKTTTKTKTEKPWHETKLK